MFEFNWKITLKKTVHYFPYVRRTVHVPNVTAMLFLLCIKTWFTTVASNVLHHHLWQCSNGHVRSWTVAHFYRSRGGCQWFDRHQKCVGEVSLHFQLEMDTLGVVSVSTDKNLKDWGRANVGAITSKTLCGHILVWCGKLTAEECSSISDTPCINTVLFIQSLAQNYVKYAILWEIYIECYTFLFILL